MDQTVINWAFIIFSGMAGWIFRMLWQAMKDLQIADTVLAKKVQEIEVLVAGNYVTNDKLDRNVAALFTKLDRIEQKLDGKADK